MFLESFSALKLSPFYIALLCLTVFEGRAVIDSSEVPYLAPHASWNGEPGSGYVGENSIEIPADVVREKFKPVANWASVESQERRLDPFPVEVVAFAKGGIEGVAFFCEGNSVFVRDHNLSSDGLSVYSVTIDPRKISRDGGIDLYAVVKPSDKSAQNRRLGPFRVWVNANETLVNSGEVYYIDSRLEIAVSGPGSKLFQLRDKIKWTPSETSSELMGVGRVYGYASNGNLVVSTIWGENPKEGAFITQVEGSVQAVASSGPVFYGSSSNDGSKGAPFQSMRQALGMKTEWSGVEFRLKAGSYAADMRTGSSKERTANYGALVVTRDPDFSRDEVWFEIKASSSTSVEPDSVVFRDVSLVQQQLIWNDRNTVPGHFVFDACRLRGDGASSGNLVVNSGDYSLVNCEIEEWLSVSPMNQSRISRNVVSRLGSGDLLSACSTALGVSIYDHQQTQNQHVDLSQIETGGQIENKLLVNVRSIRQSGQGIFFTSTERGSAIRDVAIVNCIIDAAQSQINWPMDHLLMYHVTDNSRTFEFNNDIAMDMVEVSSIEGSFSPKSKIVALNGDFEAVIPKNGWVTKGTKVYFSSRIGSLAAGETIVEYNGDGKAYVTGSVERVAPLRNNEVANCYFRHLRPYDDWIGDFILSNWEFPGLVQGSEATWRTGLVSAIVSECFTKSGGDGFLPNTVMPRRSVISQVPFDINGTLRSVSTNVGAIETSALPLAPIQPSDLRSL